MKRFCLIYLSIIFFSCSLQKTDIGEGIIWERNLNSSPSHGIEVHENSVYFSDSSGNIYSCWMDSGFLKWKRASGNKKILSFFLVENGVAVIYKDTSNDSSLLRIYSFDNGIIKYETKIPFTPKESYLSDNGKIILHSSNSIITIDRKSLRYSITQLPILFNIISVIKGDNSYLVIDEHSRIIETDLLFKYKRAFLSFNSTFMGNAVYYHGNLFLSTSSGIKGIHLPSKKILSPIFLPSSSASMILSEDTSSLFIYSGSVQKIYFTGREEYTIVDNLSIIEEPSKYLSPMFISKALKVLVTIDRNGYLNILDSRSGHFIYSRYVGNIEKPFLKIAPDYSEKAIFIPLTSPAKILCYSLSYALLKNK